MFTKALEYAKDKHEGQTRRGTGEPYIVHPIRVAKKALELNLSQEIVIAGLLHDVIEDTDSTFQEIYNIFGGDIVIIVKNLTSDEDMIKTLGKNDYLKFKMKNMDEESFILKLIDRLDNIQDNPREKYVKDTLNLMDYLITNREITNSSYIIIKDIINSCEDFYN